MAALSGNLHAYIAGTLNQNESQAIQIGGHDDHVHMVVRLSRTRTLAEVIGTVKSSSSRWIKTEDARLADFAWQAGYAAFSVGPSELDRIVAYVQRQVEHHQQFGFQEEMRRFFAEYGVEFDERYVWD